VRDMREVESPYRQNIYVVRRVCCFRELNSPLGTGTVLNVIAAFVS
jgi:hypothetical protein